MMYHNDDIYERLNGSSEAATEPEFVGPTFKMLLVGDGNVGKSAFVNRTLTGGFVPHAYKPTMGGVIDGCDFQTNFGTVRFEICDIAGQDKRSGCRDIHYEGAECAIIMFDVTSPRSYEGVARWRSEIQRVCGAALPIVVCGNKVDAHDEASRSWLRSHEAEDSSAEFGLPAGTVTTCFGGPRFGEAQAMQMADANERKIQFLERNEKAGAITTKQQGLLDTLRAAAAAAAKPAAMEEAEYHISAATGYNCEKPFMHLARKLTGEGGLIFASGPAVQRVD